MSGKSAIEWTDATWQVASGCTPASAGCRNCYSARLAGTRLRNHPRCWGLTKQAEDGRHVWTGEVRLHPDQLDQPLRWRKGRRIFVGDRTDLFHPSIPDDYIDQVWAVMALTPQHTYQILTKRPKRMRDYVADPSAAERVRQAVLTMIGPLTKACADMVSQIWPLPNVWLGTSIENQPTADARIPHLLATPAAVRWVSCEPLLGPVEIGHWLHLPPCPQHPAERAAGWGHLPCDCRPTIERKAAEGRIGKLDWVVVGGESGPHARPLHPDWARTLRDQCAEAGVAYFFKEWGEFVHCDGLPSETQEHFDAIWRTEGEFVRVGTAGRLLDGVEHNGLPGGQS